MQVLPVNTGDRAPLRRLGFETQDFLRLLLTELQHQDPLEPANEGEFISQAAQFSQLDETKRGNELLAQIAEATGDLLGAAAIIGRQARAQVDGGTVEGEITGVISSPQGMLVEVAGQRVPVSSLSEIRKGGV